MPSIHDVAREANVAPSTVSLVINGRSRVSPETRQKVNHAISRLGYQPRPRGQQPQQQPTAHTAPAHQAKPVLKHLMVLVSRRAAALNDQDSLVHIWLTAIRDKCREMNIHVSTHIGMDHVDNDPLFASQLEDKSIDALILIKTMESDGYLNRVLKTGLPCLGMNQKQNSRSVSVITLDYRQAGREVAAKLLELGHKRIAFLGDRKRWTLDELASGIEDELGKAEIKLVMDLPLNTLMPDELEKAARQMRKQKVTAIATFDPIAIMLLEMLESQSVRVPQDMSIIGFDHLHDTSKQGKRINSVDYDKSTMGVLAVQTLIQQAQVGQPLRSSLLIMNTHLTEGDTLGPPPEGAITAKEAAAVSGKSR